MDTQLVINELIQVVTDIINFIPRLLNGLIVLLIGYLIAALLRAVLRFILRRLRFDAWTDRRGLGDALRGLGINRALSDIVAQIVFILVILSFTITATRLMGLEPVAIVLQQVLAYLPTAIAALIVFLVGSIAARFVGDVVNTIASGSGLGYHGRVGRLVKYLINVFVAVLALGTLGVETAVLITAITICLAAFGLALGLALGLGARHVVYQILAGFYTRQHFVEGQTIVVQEVQGEVRSVGGTNTVMNTPTGVVVVPNSLLFESVVQSPQRPTTGAAPQQPGESTTQ
jgi:small-conductance mechanosensitive channel